MPFWQMLLGWLFPIIETEVQTVLPIATAAVNNLANDEVAAITSGDSKNTGHILAKAVQNTTTALEAAGITAGAPAVLTAVAHAVSAAQSVVTANSTLTLTPAASSPAAVETTAETTSETTTTAAPADDGSGHPGLVRSR